MTGVVRVLSGEAQRTPLQLAEACGNGLKRKPALQEAGLRLQRRQAQAGLVQVASSDHGAQLTRATLCEERYWTSRTDATIAAAVKREAFVPALTAPRVLVSEELRRAILPSNSAVRQCGVSKNHVGPRPTRQKATVQDHGHTKAAAPTRPQQGRARSINTRRTASRTTGTAAGLRRQDHL